MIKVEIFSEDLADIKLVNEYWGQDEDGKFIVKTSNLLPFKDIKTLPKLLDYILSISKAWNDKYSCPSCGEPFLCTSRTDSQSSFKHHRDCKECEIRKKEALLQRKQKEQLLLQQRIATRIEHNAKIRYDYSKIPVDIKLLLIGLGKALTSSSISNGFKVDECTELAPTGKEIFAIIKKLIAEGVIIDSPSKANSNAYVLNDDKSLSYYYYYATYVFVPDKEGTPISDTIRLLRQRRITPCDKIYQVWLDIATSDCMAYFEMQNSHHGLEIHEDDYQKINNLIRTSLEKYSISEVWSIIWRIVRDAAALSTRSYYNKDKASKTLLGKLQRLLDLILKNEASNMPWNRSQGSSVSILSQFFYELFEIDEYTPAEQVKLIFSKKDQIEDFSETHSKSMYILQQAVEYNIEKDVLNSFADLIRKGETIDATLDFIMHNYSLG